MKMALQRSIITGLCILVYAIIGNADSQVMNNERPLGVKDECLLVARNCPVPDYRVQEKINLLRDEIDKGTAVYTPEELRILRQRLEDAKKTRDFFLNEEPSLPLAY